MDDNERKILQFPPPSPGFIPSSLPFFVVGIGASAGGIEALRHFLEAMPTDNGMAFVIVLHLSPRHESHIDRILQTTTKMPVLQVTETTAIERNHAYIIPPTKDRYRKGNRGCVADTCAQTRGVCSIRSHGEQDMQMSRTGISVCAAGC